MPPINVITGSFDRAGNLPQVSDLLAGKMREKSGFLRRPQKFPGNSINPLTPHSAKQNASTQSGEGVMHKPSIIGADPGDR